MLSKTGHQRGIKRVNEVRVLERVLVPYNGPNLALIVYCSVFRRWRLFDLEKGGAYYRGAYCSLTSERGTKYRGAYFRGAKYREYGKYGIV